MVMVKYRSFMAVIRKSPFDSVFEHAEVVRDSVRIMQRLLEHYVDGKFANARRLTLKIHRLEKRADDIKHDIIEHLPRYLFMPVERNDVLRLLNNLDDIADSAENVAWTTYERPTEIPQWLKKDFMDFVKTVVNAVDTLYDAIQLVDSLLKTVFRSKEVKQMYNKLRKVSAIEHRADIMKRDITISLYQHEDEIRVTTLYHIFRLLHMLDDIADFAENAEDTLRAIVAR